MDKKFYDYVVSKNGVTNKEIAEKLCISERALNNRLNGQTSFKVGEILILANVLGIGGADVEEMFF